MRFPLILLFAILARVSALPLRESFDDTVELRNSGKVKFYLYTKTNPSTPQELLLDSKDTIHESHYERTRHTRIIIHGWGGNYKAGVNRQVREAYLADHDYNIICVDWSEYAALNYLSAKAKVPLVGEEVAEFIDFLHKDYALSFSTLVVIGHSLGAHVAGFTGKNVKGGKLAAIVGLDPAYPLYSYSNEETRLAATDAKWVETIQTNGNVKGFLKPIGSASFYPNWGRLQPGCGIDLDGSCSHGRCVNIYAEAIRGYSFAPIYKCTGFEAIEKKDAKECNTLDNQARIGDPLQVDRVKGIFYMETNDKAPFGHLSERE